MTGLPDLIGLLYRADWTRLSLSADLRADYGEEPPPTPAPTAKVPVPLVPRLAGAEAG